MSDNYIIEIRPIPAGRTVQAGTKESRLCVVQNSFRFAGFVPAFRPGLWCDDSSEASRGPSG